LLNTSLISNYEGISISNRNLLTRLPDTSEVVDYIVYFSPHESQTYKN